MRPAATPSHRKTESARPSRRSASRRTKTSQYSLRYLLREHARVMVGSLGHLYRNPVANFMTAMVIGIALALPGTLLVMLDNLQQVTGGWQDKTRISLYLKADINNPEPLRSKLARWPEIANVEVITRDQALEEFRQLSGFGDALDTLESNPLPHVLVLTPTEQASVPAVANIVVKRLSLLAEVDLAQLDLEWLKRLTAMMDVGKRIVAAIGILLGIGVLLIIGNTIRLEIQNRKEEIEVIKLVGGTDAFIRRPFLYMGCWHGLLGAVIAGLLLSAAVWQLGEPVQRLAGLYASSFQLRSIGLSHTFLLLLAGISLGLIGSWLAVGRHLGEIEPQ